MWHIRVEVADFNPRTSARCDRHHLRERPHDGQFQSTHLSEVRRTMPWLDNHGQEPFQSTHLSEVRPGCRWMRPRGCDFNPRTSARCDTVSGGSWGDAGADFNPRTSARCDNLWRDRRHTCWDFNPRTSARCDPATRSTACGYGHFNPRTSARCDTAPMCSWPTKTLFQSTHLSEVRHDRPVPVHPLLHISIHAPQRGATTLLSPRLLIISISIHAPQRGATAI